MCGRIKTLVTVQRDFDGLHVGPGLGEHACAGTAGGALHAAAQGGTRPAGRCSRRHGRRGRRSSARHVTGRRRRAATALARRPPPGVSCGRNRPRWRWCDNFHLTRPLPAKRQIVGRRADWTPIGALTSCFLLTHRGQHRALNNTVRRMAPSRGAAGRALGVFRALAARWHSGNAASNQSPESFRPKRSRNLRRAHRSGLPGRRLD